jgi:cytochrome c biogenesis protein CcdA
MIPAFAEAVRATTQPCTLLLIAPPMLAVIVTRGRWAPLVAVLVGAVAGGWLFIANVVALSETQLRVSGVVVSTALIVLAMAASVPALRWVRDIRVQSTISGGVAFLATLWWRPCVGSELGAILTDARNVGVAGQLPAMAAYMLGAMVPVVIVALVIRAIDPSPNTTKWIAGGAAGVGLVIGGALALGRHSELVTTLTGWTNA